MRSLMFRRKGLGLGSCRGISENVDGMDYYTNKVDKGLWGDVSTVFRWGCTARLLNNDVNVVNESKAISLVSNKPGFRRLLMEKAPHTIPKTWFSYLDVTQDDYPVILRPSIHSRGKNVHFCKNVDELMRAVDKHPDYYISQYVDKQEEFRVMIVQGRIAWVYKKIPEDRDAVAWNICAAGGMGENVRWGDWNRTVLDTALEAFSHSGLDFGGVDVALDVNGDAYVFEVNSAPTHSAPYRISCTSRCFDYILRNGKESIPVFEGEYNWRNYLHPALNEGVYI